MARPPLQVLDAAPGAPVRVRSFQPPGHIRTPHYLRGKCGVIERRLGPFGNPEQLAYGLPGDPLPLYRVRFTMAEVWGGKAERPDDTLDAEIYGHWLEPA
ncbi:SH3-like domain-containing protein [Oceaniglobus trochenteri]|uniref:SH3-like domain-containing protein n=1 Tax=Oceaniglobus trochenteri TaxID=2763260 RepID=UPI001CFFBFF9|nr:SH3-like domain-containing protein [Oceaniglobus trochenteri]